jgi:hypothetical protein
MVDAQTNREIIYIITVGEEKRPANSSFSPKKVSGLFPIFFIYFLRLLHKNVV